MTIELADLRRKADAAARDAEALKTALNLKTDFADALKKRVAELEQAPVMKVADPDARPARTPQQEADGLSNAMVQQIKGMWTHDEPVAAIARWAEVSPAAVRILLKLNKTAVRA